MKKRIALVVNTLSGGGAEKTAANLSRLLSERYSVDIIVNDDVHLQYPHRGRVFSLRMPADKKWMDPAYLVKALIRRTRVLKRLKKKRHYMAVLSFSEMTNLANVLSRTAGTKTILSVHNSVKNSRASSRRHWIVVNYIFPFCFKRADKTVACSKEIAEELISCCGLAPEKSAAIYNGIDLDGIKENTFENTMIPLPGAASGKDEKLIVSVGRLSRQKGHWHLIRAVRKLKDDGLPVKLMILGEGDLRDRLQKLISRAEMENEVILPGFVQNPHQYMAKADAVVFPSLYAGFSNAIAEALACGAAIVSTDHETGAREILAPDTDFHKKVHDRIDQAQYGMLVPVCDGDFCGAAEPLKKEERLMAEAIRRILTDQELNARYRAAALKRADQLDIETICRQWIEVIEE